MANKNCAGTYPVSGYKRQDGTEVSSYMRTCGAKHLGNSGTLYGSIEKTISKDIEATKKELIDFIIKNVNKSVEPELGQSIQNFIEQEPISTIQEIITKIFRKKEWVCLDYYKLSLDYSNEKLYNNQNKYLKFVDLDDDMKQFLLHKLRNEKIDNNTNVVLAHADSKLNDLLFDSATLKRTIKDNLKDIERGKYEKSSFPLIFGIDEFNLHATIKKCDIYGLKHNDLGCVTGTLVDYYDFTRIDTIPKTVKQALINGVNNNAYRQQQSGVLKPYILLAPFVCFYED